MDGVVVREEDPIPGAKEFITALREQGVPFLSAYVVGETG